MATTLTGVTIDKVGPTYDLALGFDPGTGTAQMVGYVLAKGSVFDEATDLQDNQRLVQIGSPNSTDRFTMYPKVSQGDWSGGDAQTFFVDPKRFLRNLNTDTFTPGGLTVKYIWAAVAGLSSPWITTYAAFDGDGVRSYMGGSDGTNNLAIYGTDNVVRFFAVGSSSEITDIYNGVDFVYFQTPSGIFRTQNKSNSPTFGTVVNDAGQTNPAGRTMAYIGGKLYYVGTGGNQIRYAAWPYPGSNPGTAAWTAPGQEAQLGNLLQYGNGLFFTSANWNSSNGLTGCRLYNFSGTGTPTQIGDIPGFPVGACSVNGIVYLTTLNVQYRPTSGPQLALYYTLYSVVGSTINVIDDTRLTPYDPDGFNPGVASGSTVVARAGMAGDGRFVYVAFPNWGTHIYDTAQSPAARSFTATPSPSQSSGRTPKVPGASVLTSPTAGVVVDTNHGLSIYQGGTGSNPNPLYTSPAVANTPTTASGLLDTSYFDMGAPTTTKRFMAFEVELINAVPATPANYIAVTYNLDNQTGYSNTMTLVTTTSNNLIYGFPASANKGSRVSIRITLTNGTAGAVDFVTIRSISLKARLGRVWKVSVQCRRGLVTKDGAPDAQGSPALGSPAVQMAPAQTLLGNVVMAYQQAAGRVTAFVPDATVATGAAQVQAVLEDYHITAPSGGIWSKDGASPDYEADVALTLVESL